MNRSHTDDQEAWQMFQKKLNDMRSKASNDFERLGYFMITPRLLLDKMHMSVFKNTILNSLK